MENYNLSAQNYFKFEVPGNDNINYFVQNAVIPSISMMGIETYYTNNQTVMAGNTIDYGSLTLNILMDEDFKNYISLYTWLESFRGKQEWYDLTKDTKLHILSANKKVLTTWTFIQSFPTSIQEIQFDSSVMDVVPIIFSAELRYQYFKIESISMG